MLNLDFGIRGSSRGLFKVSSQHLPGLSDLFRTANLQKGIRTTDLPNTKLECWKSHSWRWVLCNVSWRNSS